MTYKNDNMKTGAEIGYEFHYPLNPNTTFVSEGYYRHFFSYSQKEATDFKYKLSTDNRIETNSSGICTWRRFTITSLPKPRRVAFPGTEHIRTVAEL